MGVCVNVTGSLGLSLLRYHPLLKVLFLWDLPSVQMRLRPLSCELVPTIKDLGIPQEN